MRCIQTRETNILSLVEPFLGTFHTYGLKSIQGSASDTPVHLQFLAILCETRSSILTNDTYFDGIHGPYWEPSKDNNFVVNFVVTLVLRHIGIPGNEIGDRGAKHTLCLLITEMDINYADCNLLY